MCKLANSREDFLKKRRRALQGLVERRKTAIILAMRDIRNAETELWAVEHELREYGWKPREPKRPVFAGRSLLNQEKEGQ